MKLPIIIVLVVMSFLFGYLAVADAQLFVGDYDQIYFRLNANNSPITDDFTVQGEVTTSGLRTSQDLFFTGASPDIHSLDDLLIDTTGPSNDLVLSTNGISSDVVLQTDNSVSDVLLSSGGDVYVTGNAFTYNGVPVLTSTSGESYVNETGYVSGDLRMDEYYIYFTSTDEAGINAFDVDKVLTLFGSSIKLLDDLVYVGEGSATTELNFDGLTYDGQLQWDGSADNFVFQDKVVIKNDLVVDSINFTNHSVGSSFVNWEESNDDLILSSDVGGSNYFEISTSGAFLDLWANPNSANGYKLFTVTETQGDDTNMNFYEGGVGHNRFWSSGSVRIGGDESYLCSNLTSDVDCDTSSTGADLIVEDDLYIGGDSINQGNILLDGTLTHQGDLDTYFDFYSSDSIELVLGNREFLRATFDLLGVDKFYGINYENQEIDYDVHSQVSNFTYHGDSAGFSVFNGNSQENSSEVTINGGLNFDTHLYSDGEVGQDVTMSWQSRDSSYRCQRFKNGILVSYNNSGSVC